MTELEARIASIRNNPEFRDLDPGLVKIILDINDQFLEVLRECHERNDGDPAMRTPQIFLQLLTISLCLIVDTVEARKSLFNRCLAGLIAAKFDLFSGTKYRSESFEELLAPALILALKEKVSQKGKTA